MKTAQYRILRLAILAMGCAYTAIFLIRLVPRIGEELPFDTWVMLIRGVILMAIGLFIVLKLLHANEHIFFALFLVNFAWTSWTKLFENFPWQLDAITWALTAGSFVYAMIVYPGATAVSLYADHFARKQKAVWYRIPVLFFTDAKHFWSIFFPALIVLRASGHFLSDVFLDGLNILINISGLIYFKISYSLAGKTDRSRLAWILWGVVVALVITLVELLLRIFYADVSPDFFQITFALTSATICISIIMGVFFAGFLDSSLVVRSTIVYSAVFLAVIFLFSFIEHYILYGLSVVLHIEGGMTAAFLAGFLSLAVQPIHKFLEHKLPKF